VNYRLNPIQPPEDLSHLNPKHGRRIAAKLSAAARNRTEEERRVVSARNSAAAKAKIGSHYVKRA